MANETNETPNFRLPEPFQPGSRLTARNMQDLRGAIAFCLGDMIVDGPGILITKTAGGQYIFEARRAGRRGAGQPAKPFSATITGNGTPTPRAIIANGVISGSIATGQANARVPKIWQSTALVPITASPPPELPILATTTRIILQIEYSFAAKIRQVRIIASDDLPDDVLPESDATDDDENTDEDADADSGLQHVPLATVSVTDDDGDLSVTITKPQDLSASQGVELGCNNEFYRWATS